jgi:tetratricopeptide (TPR) repeat protein
MIRSEAVDLVVSAIGAGARHKIAALTRRGALEAITVPAAAAGRTFADGAAERLVTDLLTSRLAGPRGSGERFSTAELIEPALLQVVCARLWHNLPSDTTVITAQQVRAFADADTALAAHCGRVIATVAAEHDLTAERLRSWLCDTFITEPGTRGTVYEGTATTVGLPNAVARALVDQHLLSTELKSGLRWHELLSDRLIEPLRQATDEAPPAPSAVDDLREAERALAVGEFDLAQRYAGQALNTSRDFRLRARSRSLLGNLAYERDKPVEAEAHYREAARLFEAARDTGASARQLAAVGQTLLAQGRTVDAVAELRAAVDRMPNDLVVHTKLALALWQLGEGRAAVAILTSVLGIDGGNPEALQARGEILADLGDSRDAMLDLDRQVPRDRPFTAAARGLALAGLGDHPAAAREIDDAVAKAPRNGPVLLYAARVCALGGEEISSGELARRAIDATDPPLSAQHREIALRLARPA